MPIKRDSHGRFASNGGPKRASKALKSNNFAPAVASRVGMAPSAPKGAGTSRKSGKAIGVGKAVRRAGEENKSGAAKYNRAGSSAGYSKRANMNAAPGLAGAKSRSGAQPMARAEGAAKNARGGLAKAAANAVLAGHKKENLAAKRDIRGWDRRAKRK